MGFFNKNTTSQVNPQPSVQVVDIGQQVSADSSLDSLPNPNIVTTNLNPVQKPKTFRRKVISLAIIPTLVALMILISLAGWAISNRNSEDSTQDKTPVNTLDSSLVASIPVLANERGAEQIVFNEKVVANGMLVITPSLQPTESTTGQLYYDQTLNSLHLYDGTEYRQLVSIGQDQEVCIIGEDCGFATSTPATALPQDLSVTSVPTFTNINLTGNLAVSDGGTGRNTFADNSVLIGSGTGAINTTNVPLAGQLLIANSSGVPSFVNLSGDAVITSTGVINLSSGSVGASELVDTAVSAGTYGDGSNYPVFTVDSDGRITSVSNQAIAGAGVTSVNSLTGALTIQGTANQITVNSVGTTITLSAPQDIATTSSPTFSGLTVTNNLVVDTDTLHVNATTNNVGIGVANATDKLVVQGGDIVVSKSDGTWVTRFSDAGAYGTTSDILFNAGGGIGAQGSLILNIDVDNNEDASAFQVRTNAQGTNGSALLTILKDGGRVGIGDETPDGKLEVRQTGTDDIFNLYDSTVNVLSVQDGGATIFQNATNSTSALRVNNAAGSVILNVDSTNSRVGVGTATPSYALDVVGNAQISDRLQVGTTNTINQCASIIGNYSCDAGLDVNIVTTNTSTTTIGSVANAAVTASAANNADNNGTLSSLSLLGNNNYIGVNSGINGGASSIGNGNITALYGGRFLAGAFGTGTVTNLVGVNSIAGGGAAATNVTAASGIRTLVAGSSAVITNAYGLNVLSATGSSIASNYGISVQDQTVGTNDYGIAIEGADTYALWLGSGADNTDAANGITFGLSGDTNLYRSAANTLFTDDSLTVNADLAVNGGDLLTNQTIFNLLNTTATTLNIGGAATAIEVGAATGITSINNNLTVDGTLKVNTFATGIAAVDSILVPQSSISQVYSTNDPSKVPVALAVELDVDPGADNNHGIAILGHINVTRADAYIGVEGRVDATVAGGASFGVLGLASLNAADNTGTTSTGVWARSEVGTDGVSGTGTSIGLQAWGYGGATNYDAIFGDGYSAGQNSLTAFRGYITDGATAGQVTLQISDTTDTFVLDVRDAKVDGFDILLNDTAGTAQLSVKDSALATVFSVDSDGNVVVGAATNNNWATGAGDLYVQDEIELDGNLTIAEDKSINWDANGAGATSYITGTSGDILQVGNDAATGILQLQSSQLTWQNSSDSYAANFEIDSDGSAFFKSKTNATDSFQVRNAAGTAILNVDSINSRVGIGNSAPTVALDVTGAGRFTGALAVSGTLATAGKTTLLTNDITFNTFGAFDNVLSVGSGAIITIDNSGAYRGIVFNPTIQYTDPLFITGGRSFEESAILKNPNSVAQTLPHQTGFYANATIQGDGAAFTTNRTAFLDNTQYSVINSGTVSATKHVSFQAGLSSIGTGVTLTDLRGLDVANAAGSGTVTTQYGVYVGNLTKATTDYGIYIADADNYSLYLASTDGDAASGITFAGDTNLYRLSAGLLRTNGSLSVTDGQGIVLGTDSDATLTYDEATDDRVELTGTGASLFIEDRLGFGVQTLTITDDGVANDTLTPTATYVRVSIDETANGGVPNLVLSEASAKDGDLLIIVNNELDASNDTFTITDSAGVVNVPGSPITITAESTITLIYMNDRWVTLASSIN